MTQTTQSERMARMEQKQEDMATDLTEIKQEQKEGFANVAARIDELSAKQDARQEELAKKFITRAEATVIGAVITVFATVVSLWFNIKDHIN
jgi:peptidoglycan hydrolase CwlO-like protein